MLPVPPRRVANNIIACLSGNVKHNLLEVGPIKDRLRPVEISPEEKVYQTLVDMAKRRGISIAEVPFKLFFTPKNGGIIDGLYFRMDTRDYIFIDWDCSLEEKNFILAHELGHYILHKKEMETGCWAAYWKDNKFRVKKELEADRFAEKLLAFLNRANRAKKEGVK